MIAGTGASDTLVEKSLYAKLGNRVFTLQTKSHTQGAPKQLQEGGALAEAHHTGSVTNVCCRGRVESDIDL